ncbi:MAG: hypothetical protein EU529_01835 [Promethearchaeota archaeon]|nr:MAG: hypothetical protein EU529_01835 [Candidatus Lokiarchaeota archaeon]
MLEIEKPESFIKNIKIINLFLGFILIQAGLYYEIGLIIRIFIVQGYFRDPIIWGLFGILLISSGIIGLLSGFFLLKSKFIGLKLSMLTFIILSGTFTYMATFTIIYTFLHQITGLYHFAQSVRVLFYTGIVVFSIILLLSIYKNKELLKECFLIKTCYNCRAALKPPYKFCTNCGFEQRSKERKI